MRRAERHLSERLKDKYAGKKGLCPHCDGEVVVKVPELTDEVPPDSAPGSLHPSAAKANKLLVNMVSHLRTVRINRDGISVQSYSSEKCYLQVPAESCNGCEGEGF